MKERLIDRIKREFREMRIERLKRIIRNAVEKMDDLDYHAFMAYTWSRDEVNSYRVIADRYYPDREIHGTKVTYYDEDGGEEDG